MTTAATLKRWPETTIKQQVEKARKSAIARRDQTAPKVTIQPAPWEKQEEKADG